MKNYLLLIMLFLGWHVVQSQSLRGTITAANSGEPIPMANVVVKKQNAIIGGAGTDFDGDYIISPLPPGKYDVEVSFIGFQTKKITGVIISPSKATSLRVQLIEEGSLLADVELSVETYKVPIVDPFCQGNVLVRGGRSAETTYFVDDVKVLNNGFVSNESYKKNEENELFTVVENPMSTFSIDVDHASYSNVRRFINTGIKPPKDAIRIEEMVNYFDYNYQKPQNDIVGVQTELSACPWDSKKQLLHIGLQSKDIEIDDLKPSNLVFLIDVSGSMSSSNKLPLVKKTLTLLTKKLTKKDRIAIVVYAGSAGCVLPSTSGANKNKILEALNGLNSGGSTAGGQGIELAYKIAEDHFMKKGNNRVIMCTDGDFNVGQTSEMELEDLIKTKMKSNVFLTTLGFGMGNYKDDKMELLANKGNGNYAYIDNLQEAQRFLVNGYKSNLFTLAKDVKLQLEFNPKYVEKYRLVGYENRVLENRDFANDEKDAGDLGTNQSVTALYEIIPTNENTPKSNFQTTTNSDHLFHLKIRYKHPKEDKSLLFEQLIPYQLKLKSEVSDWFNFSASVAMFGLLLQDSKNNIDGTHKKVIALAKKSSNHDPNGYKSEFIRLVKAFKTGWDEEN